MNRTSHTARFFCGAAAAAITGILFQGVVGLSRPTAIEQAAQARAQAMTVAIVTPMGPTGLQSGRR